MSFIQRINSGLLKRCAATTVVLASLYSCQKEGIVYPDHEIYPITGIDISSHNGEIDFDAVAHDGIDFVFIKSTEGATFKDRRFIDNYRKAREAGLKVGVYHFFRFDSPGYMQALNFLHNLGNRPIDLPVVIDIEEWTNPATPSTPLIRSRLAEMIDHLESHGHRVMIYTNKNGYRRFVKGYFDNYPLWICSLADEPSTLPWTMWQSTHNGSIKGIDHPVDINTFNGSRDKWEEWIGATDTQ